MSNSESETETKSDTNAHTEVEAEGEREILNKEQGKQKAEEFYGKADPFDDILPSLLSAEHIKQYVLETGLISPFFEGKDEREKERLKKASYEGRIGDDAYMYNENGELVRIEISESLTIPANSIVFVSSDLNFRLPNFIALRFNLQIRHVHRGLLLGTGPLIDPLYWGKLCIPLHNLTDEDYTIPRNEGLIWIEFTKMTSDSAEGRAALSDKKEESLDDKKQFWKIEELINKASKSFTDNSHVPIRSSIPLVVKEANENSRAALYASKKAREDAESSKKYANYLQLGGIVAAVALVIGAFSLWNSFHSSMKAENEYFRAELHRTQTRTDSEANRKAEQEKIFETIKREIISNKNKIQELIIENKSLKKDLDEIRN